MGLDITWYRGLEKIEDGLDEDGEPKNDCHAKFYRWDEAFPGRADDIEEDVAYSYEDADSFHAGSYSGYGVWRNQLAQLAGYPSHGTDPTGSFCQAIWDGGITGGPFYELINFADNEGTIGTAVSAKLAQDFADFQAQADQFNWTHDWYLVKYNEWRHAFEQAAQGGAVQFH